MEESATVRGPVRHCLPRFILDFARSIYSEQRPRPYSAERRVAATRVVYCVVRWTTAILLEPLKAEPSRSDSLLPQNVFV